MLLPSSLGDQSRLVVTATTGGQTTSAQTWVMVSNPSLSAPYNLIALLNGNSSVQLTWSSDPSLPTILQISLDGGNTWKTLGVVAAGTNLATVANIPSGTGVQFRAVSGSPGLMATGTSFDATAPIADPTTDVGLSASSASTPLPNVIGPQLGNPMLLANQATIDLFRAGFPGFQDPTARYRKEVQLVTYPSYNGSGQPASGTCTMAYPPIPATGYSTIDPGPIYGQWCYDGIPIGATINSDTSASDQWADPHGLVNASVTLSQPWTQSQFISQAPSLVPPFSGVFQDPPTASLFEWLSQGTQDDHITIQNLQYKWQLEASDAGVVAWYVVFTPSGGGAPTYYTMTWDPQGAAGTTSPVCSIDAFHGTVLGPDGNPVSGVIIMPATGNGTTPAAAPAGQVQTGYSIATPSMQILQASPDAAGNLTLNSFGGPDRQPVSSVHMCRWLGAAPGATNASTTAFYQNFGTFPSNDPDQFIIQFTRPEKTGVGYLNVQVSTTSPGGMAFSLAKTIVLNELNGPDGPTGIFQSDPLALVADSQDAQAPSTILGVLGGQIIITTSDLANKKYPFNVQAAQQLLYVDCLTVPFPSNVQEYNATATVTTGGQAQNYSVALGTANYTQAISDQLRTLTAVYAQLGVSVVVSQVPSPPALTPQQYGQMESNTFNLGSPNDPNSNLSAMRNLYTPYKQAQHILVVMTPGYFQDAPVTAGVTLSSISNVAGQGDGWTFIAVPVLLPASVTTGNVVVQKTPNASYVTAHEAAHTLGLATLQGAQNNHWNDDPSAGSLRVSHLPFELMFLSTQNGYNSADPKPYQDQKRFSWDDILMLQGGKVGNYPSSAAQFYLIPAQ